MIKKIYLFFSNTLTLLILFSAAIFFIFFTQESIVFLAQKYLKENDIGYKTIQGSLFEGVVIRDLNYKDSIKIEEIVVSYNLLKLLNPTVGVKSLIANGVYVDIDKFLKDYDQDLSLGMIALNIEKADLKEANIVYRGDSYIFDLDAENLSIRDALEIEKLKLRLNSPFVKAYINGSVESNRLRGKSDLIVNDKFLGLIGEKPKKLYAEVDISTDEIYIKTYADKITLKNIDNLELKNADIELFYSFKEDFLTLFAKYRAFYDGFEAFAKQQIRIGFNSVYESKIDADLLKYGYELPFKKFTLKTKTYDDITDADFGAEGFIVKTSTNDYKNYTFNADTRYGDLYGKVAADKNGYTLNAEFSPKKDIPYFKELKLEKFPKLNLYLSKNKDETKVEISKDPVSITLIKNSEDKIKGFAKIGSNSFDIKGDLTKKEFRVDSDINSIKTLLKDIDVKIFDEDLDIEADMGTSSFISYKDRLEITTKLDLHSYKLKLDSQNIYSGKDAFFEFFYADDEVALRKYKLKILNHKIESQKTSKIDIDKDKNIYLREFWVYDNLLFSGKISLSDMNADLRLLSENFHYETKDVNVTLRADLQIFANSKGVQRVEGDVTILEGSIYYAPQREYAIGDEDIIIIQDIKPEKSMPNRDLNIRVNSLKPLHYKIKEADVTFTPNLNVYQEIGSKMNIYGQVDIHGGKVNISDKIFEVDKSEIYLYDDAYMNPHLNLNLHYYTLENADISIYITNRVNSPVIIFASNPQMSQEDIMSYILFGSSASSVFDNAKNSRASLSSVLLGASLKEMLNRSTHLKIDTLNILTNENGTLGYEIGTRFSKKVRIVYKNDEISSLILQYTLNKSLRIDVDVKETGQGVSIYYMRDF